MAKSSAASIQNHRTRKRIKDMGEVFTPDQYVQQMLSLFDEKDWSDENIIFFEPTCGHGNIALSIVERRISAFTKKYLSARIEQCLLHAVANAVHTLWAVDICPLNIELTRKRIIGMVVRTLQTTQFDIRHPEMRNFMAHVLCTLVWQIDENETLSALSGETTAQTKASQTKLGKEWIKTNKHKSIDFHLDWCEFYKQSKVRNTVPQLYQRALRFLGLSIAGCKTRAFQDFHFSQHAMQLLIENHGRQSMLAEVA